MAQEELNKITEEMNEETEGMDEVSVDALESVTGGIDTSIVDHIFKDNNPMLNKRATLKRYYLTYHTMLSQRKYTSTRQKDDLVSMCNHIKDLISRLP